jgi:hypothetical protein
MTNIGDINEGLERGAVASDSGAASYQTVVEQLDSANGAIGDGFLYSEIARGHADAAAESRTEAAQMIATAATTLDGTIALLRLADVAVDRASTHNESARASLTTAAGNQSQVADKLSETETPAAEGLAALQESVGHLSGAVGELTPTDRARANVANAEDANGILRALTHRAGSLQQTGQRAIEHAESDLRFDQQTREEIGHAIDQAQLAIDALNAISLQLQRSTGQTPNLQTDINATRTEGEQVAASVNIVKASVAFLVQSCEDTATTARNVKR